ncbi:precorrin-6y C5,15-methyltransferase (decarboxylating) subunit CbiE [Consotaella salsifontis]|uniref:Precorrin-6Y C5,15-methyltransferase (Decarboxylating) n=1 Tax=Consotaella salsifontis TaxID=1365950 RepID=A0A1T4SIQ3_9HYPH|nr:precorrin-6y C5,15-methyltransferase (decarboxylating) subunit CbiE [Consotaella salsifontis]SKA28204.1 precorrin-6Y C5,15-methyltransferase (decarboxylating) [Consotaella salsifontis]
MTAWLTIIGIGDGGLETLTPEARRCLAHAEAIVGGARHLAMLGADIRGERIAWGSPLAATVPEIEARRGRPVVVLASGDPMWFGVGATLARHFPIEEIRVIPAPSAFSLAAARLGWALQDVSTLTVHGRPLDAVDSALAPGARLLVLSENGATPAMLARHLAERGFSASRLVVLEHLGGAKERVRSAHADDFSLGDIADLNVVAIDCALSSGARWFARGAGLPDDAFVHDGKMTKRVLRAVALAALRPAAGETLWDIGAGCGSISVEWVRGAPGARAFALEPRPERRSMIADNARRLLARGITIIDGEAPAVLAGLPRPDAVFIGGGLTNETVDAALAVLPCGGRLVAHAVTLESEALLLALHARLGGELSRVSVAYAAPVGPYRGWKPAMPVTHWFLTKEADA